MGGEWSRPQGQLGVGRERDGGREGSRAGEREVEEIHV